MVRGASGTNHVSCLVNGSEWGCEVIGERVVEFYMDRKLTESQLRDELVIVEFSS